VAALLTQNNGEYVLRLGQHPSHEELFVGNLSDESPRWSGTPRSIEEIDTLHGNITKIVEEVGGKVLSNILFLFADIADAQKTSVLFEVRTGHPRISLLLRLPPPNVSLTPEVRCAVVGNVDSGKSTTLGVLTRGMLNKSTQTGVSHPSFFRRTR
jgi:hypothetical protein